MRTSQGNYNFNLYSCKCVGSLLIYHILKRISVGIKKLFIQYLKCHLIFGILDTYKKNHEYCMSVELKLFYNQEYIKSKKCFSIFMHNVFFSGVFSYIKFVIFKGGNIYSRMVLEDSSKICMGCDPQFLSALKLSCHCFEYKLGECKCKDFT